MINWYQKLDNPHKSLLFKVAHCAGCISDNTRPQQLHWGDQDMETAISCIECSQVAGLIQNVVQNLQKHRLFVQLLLVLACRTKKRVGLFF